MHAKQPSTQGVATNATASLPLGHRHHTSGAFPLVLGSALLGTIGVFVQNGHTDPLTMTWFRCAFGLVGLTLWLALRGQLGAVRLARSTWPWVVAAGFLLLTGWILFFAAIPRTSTGMAVVLFQFQPLWVVALGAFWLREPIGMLRLASICMAMVGLTLATGILQAQTGMGRHDALAPQYWLGVGFCLIGSWCTALVTIIAKRLSELPAGVLAWWQCAIGAAILWLWPIAHGWPSLGASWLWLAGLGLIHTGLVYALMYAGIGKLPTSRTAVLQFAYPAVAVTIDWAYLGIRMDDVQLLGVGVMAVAILLAGNMRTPAYPPMERLRQ